MLIGKILHLALVLNGAFANETILNNDQEKRELAQNNHNIHNCLFYMSNLLALVCEESAEGGGKGAKEPAPFVSIVPPSVIYKSYFPNSLNFHQDFEPFQRITNRTGVE